MSDIDWGVIVEITQGGVEVDIVGLTNEAAIDLLREAITRLEAPPASTTPGGPDA